MAATWPGKDADPPVLRKDGLTEWTIRSRMPCGKAMRGTSAQKNPQSAYNKGHAALDDHVRQHLKICKKCPPDTPRPRGG